MAANRLPRLRHLLEYAADKFGRIVVGSEWGAKSIELGSVDLEAILSLLIEHDELFLASFNVKVDRP